MTAERCPIVFGPVTSRRLGRSLGVNNIPPKSCCYACVYCQAGPTTSLAVERQTFYDPDVVAGGPSSTRWSGNAGSSSSTSPANGSTGPPSRWARDRRARGGPPGGDDDSRAAGSNGPLPG